MHVLKRTWQAAGLLLHQPRIWDRNSGLAGALRGSEDRRAGRLLCAHPGIFWMVGAPRSCSNVLRGP